MRCSTEVAGTNTGFIQESQGVKNLFYSRTVLERPAIVGDSPVDEIKQTSHWFPKYCGTREIPWESGWTITQD